MFIWARACHVICVSASETFPNKGFAAGVKHIACICLCECVPVFATRLTTCMLTLTVRRDGLSDHRTGNV